jgi:hypothetical protein
MLLLLLLVVALLQTTDHRAHASGKQTPPRDRADAQYESMTDDLAQRTVSEVVPEVEELRGLTFKRTVPVSVIDDAAARRHMLQRLDSFQTTEEIAAVQLAYVTLGLMPADIDIVTVFLETLEEQAGGFYDPEAASVYVLGDMPAMLAPAITAHELTHALEDQYYDLDGRMHEVGAVHEGSANLLMSVFLARRVLNGLADPEELMAMDVGEPGDSAVLDRLPEVLLRQLVGPYLLGAEFLARADLASVAEDGYPSGQVDRAYADSPVSSEQILHPRKYWDAESRDDPRSVELNDAGRLLGDRWERTMEGKLGELSLGVLVGARTPLTEQWIGDTGEHWTNPAAAGWGGDRWELWVRGKSAVVLLGTVWDSSADASEFASALPRRKGLHWRVSGDRVALVAGDLPGKRARRLLERMLGDGQIEAR